MTIRKILTEPDKFLRQVSKTVLKVTDEERRLMDDMLETMYDANGIGLAAIQVGVPKRILVIDLGKKDLNYGQNKRSDIHLKMYGNKSFDKKIHQKYLQHEDINNLKGLEVELIYKWEVGSMLIFDRTHLHCSSSVIEGKKIGIATFTKK